ncbi:M23 family metallopeptidase [Hespellia stercorisuis]|uniref:Murein DD-endopeptidase MepM and murein hydrolase activator NlpD, contain LysM domain n=1 Tax=Hespellia stercorisuis DSM 15480 TaxID=1121950 RepID=A0A1M6P4A8_9FIRM|nr:M23 family metallopeptidase [Hespellia stercorisuis]SHK02807.1 Murein DD-endopeptidase MepM and murein hydrolase activator NlpD, contain LysM domain [Hespellia stercorisuis DSM 15480]
MNLKNEDKNTQMRGKSTTVGIVLCFVAVIVMVGAYTFRASQNKLDEQIAKSEELAKEITENENKEANTGNITNPNEGADGESSTGDTSNTADTVEEESVAETNEESAATATPADSLYFDEESILEWPASGAIVLNYSMDKTIYDPTLEQYQYNPALVIGGQVGEEILASAAGTVETISQTAETGLTVTLNMGNGYQAVYGQLKEVPVQQGEYVEKGVLLGYLSEPTKYYSVEGPCLYFEVQKDGNPVNPVDFME